MIVNVVVLAHSPDDGVNVYVVVIVLFNAGAHVPAIPLFDVVGNALNASPSQIGATASKVGSTFALGVTSTSSELSPVFISYPL